MLSGVWMTLRLMATAGSVTITDPSGKDTTHSQGDIFIIPKGLAFLTSEQFQAWAFDVPRHATQVRKTPSWPRSWANFSFLQLCSHRNAWANLHLLGQPNNFLASAG